MEIGRRKLSRKFKLLFGVKVYMAYLEALPSMGKGPREERTF
jgi:hypothetical protein